VLEQIRARFPHLKLIWADGGYAGPKLNDWVQRMCHWVLSIVKRSDDVKGFQVLPRRGVVERTFGWLNRCRRLSKDFEQLPATEEAWLYCGHDAFDVASIGPRAHQRLGAGTRVKTV